MTTQKKHKKKSRLGSFIGPFLAVVIIGASVGVFAGSRLLGDDFDIMAIFGNRETTAAPAPEPEISQRDELLARLPLIATRQHSTPGALMADFMDVLSLMYGHYLTEEIMFTEVIRVQRTLFGQELLDMNSFDSQVQQFVATTRHHRDHGVFQTDIELIDIQFEPEYTIAHVSQHFSNLGTLNWVYFINYEDGFKITSFFQADEHFTPIRGWLDYQ